MKILTSALLLFAVLAPASDTNQATTYIAHYLEPFHGPQAYKDAGSGVIFYVESDGRHVAAIGPDGKVLWNRDPFSDARLEFYRTKTPRIVYIGKTSPRNEAYWATNGIPKVIGIAYNSSQFGELDVRTGDFKFHGQD